MGLQSNSLLNHILTNWPFGSIRTISVLEKQGIYRQLAYKYVHSGWLVHLGFGVYMRSGDPITWLGAVYGLQEAGLDFYVGGKTALELHGAGHFISLAKESYINIYSETLTTLPKWLNKYNKDVTFKLNKINLFNNQIGLIDYQSQGFNVTISTAERAMIELLDGVSDQASFEEANYLMEGLGTLRPQILQPLLENCKSIKVKRLFLFLAEYNDHLWVKELVLNRITIGSGNRSIVRGGVLNKKYLITVPKTLLKINIEDIP